MFAWTRRRPRDPSPEKQEALFAGSFYDIRGGAGWLEGRRGITTGAECDFGLGAVIALARDDPSAHCARMPPELHKVKPRVA